MSAEATATPGEFWKSTHANARLDRAHLLTNALTAVVASLGLPQDRAAVVIGAMRMATVRAPHQSRARPAA
jgi:hypothetical protein